MVKEKTIRELVNRVAATHGYDTDMESVTAYQDLIGHATIEENRALANDPALNETFYRIYGLAYGTIEAIKFYMANSDKVAGLKGELADYKEGFQDKCKELEVAKDRIEEQKNKITELDGRIHELNRDMEGTQQSLREKEDEIVRLKAKLYDSLHMNTQDIIKALKGDKDEQ